MTTTIKNKNSLELLDWHIALLYLVLIVLSVSSFGWGETVFLEIVQGRISALNPQMVWFTTYGFVLALGLLFVWVLRLKPSERRWVVPFLLAIFTGFFLSHLVKYLFQNQRPYDIFEIIPLVKERTLSFPSTHATLAFALFPLLHVLRPWLSWVWLLVAFLVAFSRVYVGVHLPQEVLVGAFLGLFIGDMWRVLVQKFNFFDHWEEKLELRRQTFHMIFGLLVVFALKWQVIPIWFLLVIALGGILLSFLSLRMRVPVVSYFLERFERKYLLRVFPGRGAFFFVLASWLTLYLFDFYIALSAILILALMDSSAHFVGKYWGKIPNPLNRRKHLEGFFVGLLAGFLGALFFVPPVVALWGAVAGSVIEIFEIKIGQHKIDDNLTVPLASGLVMSWLMFS